MSGGLDAGSVYTILGGRFDPAAFEQFDAANKRSIANAAEAEGKLSSSAGRLSSAHERAARAISSVTSEGQRLAGNAPLRAMDLWAKNSSAASKNLSTLGNVGAKTAAVGLLSLAGATIYAVKTAGDFEKQMRNVNSIAKLNEGQYRSLAKSVLGLAGETAQSPKVLAEGLYQLVSSGFNASDSLLILKASAKAATAGLTDTATATTAVAAVLNAYRLPATEADHVSDILFETVNRGVLTFAELSKEIGTVLPFASALGVPLKDVGAAISTMTKEGISAPETMTRIKQAMVSIIKPSADMKKAIKETGASSGQALIEQRGFQGGLEALVKTTDGSKEALSKLFPNIRATGGVLALTGKNARSAQGDLKAFQDTAGATNKVFDEQAKGAEFAGKRLVTSLETDAIIIGDRFLPILGKGAADLARTLQEAAQDGTLERIGQEAEHVFSSVGTAAQDAAPPIEFTARALLDLGKALGLTNPAEIAALAVGFLAFRGATFVGPILLSIAGAISEIGVAAATAPGIAAFGADLVALAGGPVGALAIALGIAAAGFVAIESGLFSSSSAADANAAALQHDKEAVEQLNHAVDGSAKSHFAAERASINHRTAETDLKRTEKEVADGTLKGTEAQDRLAEAHLRVQEAADEVTTANEHQAASLQKQQTQAEKAKDVTGSRQREIFKQIQALEAENTAYGTRNRTLANGESAQARLTKLQREYNQAAKESQQAIAQIELAELSRNRIQHGQTAIKPANAQGVAALQSTLSELPTQVRLKYELDDQGTLSKLGVLAARLDQVGQQQTVVKILTNAPSAAAALAALEAVKRGISPTKVIRILHNAPSAKAAIEQLHAAISALHGKLIPLTTTASQAGGQVSSLQSEIDALHGKAIEVVVTTVQKALKLGGHASGRGAGSSEAAVVGEGRGPEYVIDGRTGAGYKTRGPMLAGLNPSEYVIPTEDRYHGRALGLYAMLSRDLGIPGYKAGKAPKSKSHKKPMPVPSAIPPLSLPLSDIESKEAEAKSKYDKAATKVNSLEGQIRTAERNVRYAKKGTKKKDQEKLSELQAELRKAKGSHDYTVEHRQMQEWQRTLKEAKQYQTRINNATLEANNAGNQMRLAAEHGDEAGYETAKGKRVGALGKLQGLIRQAEKQVKTGTEYALQLEGDLQNAQLESGQTSGEPFPEEPETGLTPDQVKEQKRLEASAALAALTPGLADDTSAAQQLVSFFEGALSSGQQRGASSDVIIELAGAVKTARSNLESFTGNGTNENSDVQAQINQANERAEAAKREADINRQALEVFGGSGDIGQGGANARGAVVINQTVNTLHPGDPATQLAVANAAAGGFGYQGGRQSPRVQVGP